MEFGAVHFGLLMAGLVIGYGCGWLAGRAGRKKKRTPSRASHSRTDVAMLRNPPVNSLAEASKSEVFALRVCRADVTGRALHPIVHHLKDVVSECRERGEYGHRLRVVPIDIGEWSDLRADDAVLEHFARIHDECPHLPFWLTDDVIEHYLDCVYRGLRLRDGEAKEPMTWDRFQSDVAKRAGERIARDMDGSAPKELVAKLMGEGMARFGLCVAKLDPMRNIDAPADEPAARA